jgi:hypothetical protein
MHDNRDDYEPIIATRPSSKPEPEDAKPLWPLVLALGGGVAVALVLAWWFMSRSPGEGASATAQPESPAQEFGPEIQVEEPAAPPARDAEANTPAAQPSAPPAPAAEPQTSADQPATEQTTPDQPTTEQPAGDQAAAPQESAPESSPEVVPETSVPPPVAPADVPVHFVSPDAQVRFELRGAEDSSAALTSKAGELMNIAPGTYRVVASGTQLETFEQQVTFDGVSPVEYSVTLCAERKRERENLAGHVVEERACTSTEQCESMFLLLSEEADQLVKDRAFRTQQCTKWRANAAPEGKWTLDTKCDGASAASTCRIEIAEGACTFSEPARSVRGGECPKGELK